MFSGAQTIDRGYAMKVNGSIASDGRSVCSFTIIVDKPVK